MSDSDLDGASIKKEFTRLDKLLEHRTRLAICALLQRYDQINFRRFKELLNETDGNLGAQLRKLEEAGYIKVEKLFEERRPVSWYKICPEGKAALKNHLDGLKGILGED